jgi:signal transduction histidine kinase
MVSGGGGSGATKRFASPRRYMKSAMNRTMSVVTSETMPPPKTNMKSRLITTTSLWALPASSPGFQHRAKKTYDDAHAHALRVQLIVARHRIFCNNSRPFYPVRKCVSNHLLQSQRFDAILALMVDPTISAIAIVIQTQEEERYRMARLLQEGPAQLLANAVAEIETYLALVDKRPDTARSGLTDLLQELHQGLSQTRSLISELQPPLLGELGLAACLQKYAEDFSQRTGIATRLGGWNSLTERFPTTMETAIFRVVQEALDNVREHARADKAEINLERRNNQLIVTIVDNGQGFDPSRGGVSGRRLGIVAMRDRAEVLGGNLQIFSEPNKGVRVVLSAPLRAPEPRSQLRSI